MLSSISTHAYIDALLLTSLAGCRQRFRARERPRERRRRRLKGDVRAAAAVGSGRARGESRRVRISSLFFWFGIVFNGFASFACLRFSLAPAIFNSFGSMIFRFQIQICKVDVSLLVYFSLFVFVRIRFKNDAHFFVDTFHLCFLISVFTCNLNLAVSSSISPELHYLLVCLPMIACLDRSYR